MPHLNYIAPKHHWETPVGDGLLTKQDAVPGEVLQQSGFGLVLFGIFLNFLGDGKGNVQVQSEDDPQLGRARSSLAERVRLSDDLHQLGKWCEKDNL